MKKKRHLDTGGRYDDYTFSPYVAGIGVPVYLPSKGNHSWSTYTTKDGTKVYPVNNAGLPYANLNEVNITADRPGWQQGLTEYDWARARLYYGNPDGTVNSRGIMFLKDIARHRRTCLSDFMRNTNRQSVNHERKFTVKDNDIEDKRTQVIKSWSSKLHEQENATNKGLIVTPSNDSTWYPYASYEGGAKTVYDGLKLNKNTKALRIIDAQGYLTNNQAKELKREAMLAHYNKAKIIFDNEVGAGSWDDLSVDEQRVLSDYNYTGSLQQFKKLMHAVKNKDGNTIMKEYKRYSNGKPLTKRNHETEKDWQNIIAKY